MAQPLSPNDARALQQALTLLDGGDARAAGAAMLALTPAGRGHPDSLAIAGLILTALDRKAEAKRAFEQSLALAPGNAQGWNAYGNLLGEMGLAAEAVAALRRATELRPDYVEAFVNLGLHATDAGDYATAAEALQRATALAPSDARGWAALGALEQARQDWAAAAGHFRQALSIRDDARARHNLAVSLRRLDRPDAALEEVERALAGGLAGPDTQTLRAHLLADVGRFDEAVAAYRAVTREAPAHLDAQETLARLLPQLGRGGEALGGFRSALEQAPGARPLWNAAMATAKALGEPAQLLEWAQAAERRFGAEPDLVLARASAQMMLGEAQTARDALLPLAAAHPDQVGVQLHLASALIQSGDPARAEAPALRATELAPLDQWGWSYLTVIWRLLGDAREDWLADYDRFVMPVDVPPPPGFADQNDFLAALTERLTALHTTHAHPADQTLRYGTQTRGNLFEKTDPLIQGLADSIRGAVERRIAALPHDPAHPFLGRNSGRIAFSASWSVRLRSTGFHINHIHPSGWLSSALHISLPPEVTGEGALPAGALTFGVPDKAFGLDLPPRQIEVPKPGQLVIFPSYFWHGTLPFESEEPRLTVAFDALPV